jgi:hypothetical protein
MNRQQRRATQAQARRAQVGDTIFTTTISAVLRDGTTALYWVVVPEGMTDEQAAETQEWHGPFKTNAEVSEDQRLVLLGPDCKVTEGGQWAPAWDKPQ